MSDWSAAGLPWPDKEGYEITHVINPKRTPFYTSHPSQKQSTDFGEIHSLYYYLKFEHLSIFQQFYENNNPFSLDVISDKVPYEITGRIIEDPEIKSLHDDNYFLHIMFERAFSYFRVTQHPMTEIDHLTTVFNVTQHNLTEILELVNPRFQSTQHNLSEILDASGNY